MPFLISFLDGLDLVFCAVAFDSVGGLVTFLACFLRVADEAEDFDGLGIDATVSVTSQAKGHKEDLIPGVSPFS